MSDSFLDELLEKEDARLGMMTPAQYAQFKMDEQKMVREMAQAEQEKLNEEYLLSSTANECFCQSGCNNNQCVVANSKCPGAKPCTWAGTFGKPLVAVANPLLSIAKSIPGLNNFVPAQPIQQVQHCKPCDVKSGGTRRPNFLHAQGLPMLRWGGYVPARMGGVGFFRPSLPARTAPPPPLMSPYGRLSFRDRRQGAAAAKKKKKNQKKKNANNLDKSAKSTGVAVAIEDDIKTLDMVMGVYEQLGGAWFTEEQGEELMDFIAKYETPWVQTYREIPGRIRDGEDGKMLSKLAEGAETAIDKLQQYTVKLAKSGRTPTLQQIKTQFANFFASLVTVDHLPRPKKSKPKKKKA